MKAKIIFIFIFINWTLYSQFVINNAVHSDTLNFNIEQVNAIVQWQTSSDSVAWENIENATNISYNHIYNTNILLQFFRASITEEDCPTYYSPTLKIIRDIPTFYWSDNDAWLSNQKPIENEDAQIPMGRRILLDESPPPLSGITVSGILEFVDKDLNLTCDYILVEGTLAIGSEQNPFQSKAIITLTGDVLTQNIMGMGTRGIMVMGGNLELHGFEKQVVWTKINNHITSGSSAIELTQSVNWPANDEIVLSPTDYYLAGNGSSVAQKLNINSLNGANLTVNEPINAFRWGLLQYATTNGMSLIEENILASPIADNDTAFTPKILDERAYVGNLTRNIVIQSIEDNLWTSNGFGAHVMIMSSNSSAHINSVEIRRAGQRGRLGRYPIHWHMLSYSGTQTLPDASGQYIRNCAIHNTKNRGIVIHGTNGLLVKNNVLFDVEGHGIFTEDAVERRNIIDSNLVMHVRNPQLPPNLALKQHEVGERGSSGFWISNPDNTITNNVASDCGTNGFWISFPSNPWGASASVLGENGLIMNPSRIRFGVFDNNVSHSNGLEGIMLDFVEIDNEGNVFPRQYASTTNGTDPQWPNTTLLFFKLSNYKVWKNSGNGIWDRARRPNNYGVVSADNCGRFFAGSGDDGIIERSLVVGTSLNYNMNGMERPVLADFFLNSSNPDPVAFATYHSTFDIKNNLILNFPVVENMRSGAFSTDDYYTRAVEKGHIRNTNNFIFNSHGGFKLRAFGDYFTLASCLWDPNGIWGPAENYFVYDEPFLTFSKPITTVLPNSATSGGVSVPGPFYGFEGFVLHGVGDTPPQNQPYMDLMGLHVRRLDQNLNEVATWTVQAAEADYMLQHMRDFATSPDGIYELTFPQETSQPTDFQVNVENMMTTNDTQVIGIQFDGSINPTVYLQSPGSLRTYTNVNSLNEVINSSGETFWQDVQNNRVWIKIQGGYWQYWTNDPLVSVPSNDDLLYNTSILRIFQQ